MARRALWDVGLDYGHPTGHGIGAYLNVHEYPPLISTHNLPPGMCTNMFTSNEPGYYAANEFGIRLENVLQVTELENSKSYFDGRGANKFQDVTMVPIQTKLINIDLLSDPEVSRSYARTKRIYDFDLIYCVPFCWFQIRWLNDYHKKIRENISPLLSNNSNIVDWLERETREISNGKDDCNEVTTTEPNDKETSPTPTPTTA